MNTKKESLLVYYQCEHCGVHSVQSTPPLSDKRSGQLLSGAKPTVFAKVRLSNKCPECGSKQSWSTIDLRIAKWCMVALAFLFAAVVFLLQQEKISFDFWRVLLHAQPIITAALLLSAAVFIVRYARGIYRIKKSASSAPIFGRTMEEIKEKAGEIPDYVTAKQKKEK